MLYTERIAVSSTWFSLFFFVQFVSVFRVQRESVAVRMSIEPHFNFQLNTNRCSDGWRECIFSVNVYILLDFRLTRTRDVSQFPVISPAEPTAVVHVDEQSKHILTAALPLSQSQFSIFSRCMAFPSSAPHSLSPSCCFALFVCLSSFHVHSFGGDNPVAATLLGGLKFQRIWKLYEAHTHTIFESVHIIKLHICSIHAEQMCSVVCWHLKWENRKYMFRYRSVKTWQQRVTHNVTRTQYN